MAALPYMQLYVADYLADTAHLTTEEHGAYLLLLFSYWQTGKPLRADRLASVAKVPNERWPDVEQTLREFFHVSKGTWTHFRVEADLAKVDSKSKKNSEAGKLSAKAKALAKQALEDEQATNASTNVEQTYQRNVNHARSGDTDTDTDTDTDKSKDQKPCSSASAEHVPFDHFWNLYPKKVGKAKAMKVWEKIKPDMILFASIEESLQRAKRSPDWIKSAGQFIPHPSVWLNGRRWEDEPDSLGDLPYEEIGRVYNEECSRVFRPCEAMTADRMLLIRELASQEVAGKKRFLEGGLDYWRRFFSVAAKSKNWAGENRAGFIADLDYVLKNATAVFEATK